MDKIYKEQNDSIIDLQKEVDKLKKELQAEREINVGHRNQNNVISNWLVDYKKEVDELKKKEEKHIKMFAGWLMDEGYLIDGEQTKDLDINRLYSYWNVN